MSEDIDTFISTAPGLRFAFAIKAKVGPIQDLGSTARGHRRIIDILGGEVHGPRLEGEILPGGADWQIVRPDGTIEVVARYTIRTKAGALVYVQNASLEIAWTAVVRDRRTIAGDVVVPFISEGHEGFDINVFDRYTPLTDIVDKALQK